MEKSWRVSVEKEGTIDNRILISRHRIEGLNWQKCPEFYGWKYGGHFERQAAIRWSNTPHHSYIAVHAWK